MQVTTNMHIMTRLNKQY